MPRGRGRGRCSTTSARGQKRRVEAEPEELDTRDKWWSRFRGGSSAEVAGHFGQASKTTASTRAESSAASAVSVPSSDKDIDAHEDPFDDKDIDAAEAARLADDLVVPPAQDFPGVSTLAAFLENIGGNLEQGLLTESNLKQFETKLAMGRDTMSAEVEAVSRAGLNAADKARLAALEKAVKDQHVDPRSSMGVWFRDAMKTRQDESVVYAGLNRTDAAT